MKKQSGIVQGLAAACVATWISPALADPQVQADIESVRIYQEDVKVYQEGGVTVEGKDVEAWFREGADWQWPNSSMPIVNVRFGKKGDGFNDSPQNADIRVAAGVFAAGDVAIGAWGFGGIALGGLAIGGVCLGLLALGGVNLGFVAAGGVAVGWAFAAGGVAVGRNAFGAVAVGQNAFGCIAVGRRAYGVIAIGSEGWGLIPLTGSFARLITGRRDRFYSLLF